jgi:hypothetical protein
MTDDLHDAAESISDAAESVADAAEDAVTAPIAVIDSEPIADAIEGAADESTHLDHEGRIAALEASSAVIPEHTHTELAAIGHTHVDELPPLLDDIPAPEAPPETTDEPTDTAPERTHPLLMRPFAKGDE